MHIAGYTCVLLAALGGLSDEIKERGVVDLGNTARLEHVLAKARRGERVVVGVIGGSITAGAVTSSEDRRWANGVAQWWRDRFPDADVELVNAGIGATGSDLGAHRVKKHLLAHNPDFVVVEYAVNDSISPLAAETFEGVVRQLLRHPCQPAVMTVFMMNHKGQNVQDAHLPVARHYGLPAVSYRDTLWPEIEAGRMQWDAISADFVHPNDRGHAYCAELIAEPLERVLEDLPADGDLPELPDVPAPLIGDIFERAAYLSADDVSRVKNHGWEPRRSGSYGQGWVAYKPGSVLQCEVEGTAIAIAYHKIKADVGIVEASIDDGPPVRIDAYFKNDWGGGYTPYQLLARNLKPGTHTVRVKLLEERNAESRGHEFPLFTILAAGRDAQAATR